MATKFAMGPVTLNCTQLRGYMVIYLENFDRLMKIYFGPKKLKKYCKVKKKKELEFFVILFHERF